MEIRSESNEKKKKKDREKRKRVMRGNVLEVVVGAVERMGYECEKRWTSMTEAKGRLK